MNYLNKSHELYHELLNFLKYETTSHDCHDFIELLHQYDKNLIHLNPFKWNTSNPSER